MSAALAMGTRLGGKYRIERVLGEGGMAAVYLAVNEDIGREVAIKVLHVEVANIPGLLERFRREARATSAIGHPGIVDVLDMGRTDDGAPFMVMERLQGMTLAERIVQDQRLTPLEATRIVLPVLDVLEAAHAKGVVHRDLKPENIFLAEKPIAAVKVLDFGIAFMHGQDDTRLTHTGATMGTPMYMSPEQARDASTVGPTTDLYAVGVILFFLIEGWPPFFGESYNQVLSKILTEPAPPMVAPGVPPALARLVARLLEKDPAARPATASEVRDMLSSAVGLTAPMTVPMEVPPQMTLANAPTLPGTPRARWWPWAAGAVIAAGVAVAVVASKGGGTTTPTPAATPSSPPDAARVVAATPPPPATPDAARVAVSPARTPDAAPSKPIRKTPGRPTAVARPVATSVTPDAAPKRPTDTEIDTHIKLGP